MQRVLIASKYQYLCSRIRSFLIESPRRGESFFQIDPASLSTLSSELNGRLPPGVISFD